MLPIIRCRHALLTLIAVLVVLMAATGSARAGDPPDRVARLNYISGQVSFRPASLDDWGVATLNYPLTTGDHLWTEQEASAELHVGSSVFRLAPETAFAFLNLDDDVVQSRVAEGTIDVRVCEMLGRDVYEVDTPNAAISILAPGLYRIDVDPEGNRTRVTVRTGEVQVDGNDRSFSVYPGQMAEIIGTDEITYDLGRAPSPDRWELWCRDRDRRDDNRVALTYVSRDMIGYEDLDDYGSWSYVPEYGYAWQPTVVAVDWAPYRYGHWAFVRPWGWTWIDSAQWGFAPFHYGRWACYQSRWIWVPGQRMPRPVWAPALVAFVGGRDWNFAFGFGTRPAVGWFPLAPGELYCPNYRVSPVYLRNVNAATVSAPHLSVTTITVATMRYANRSVAGAMTAVPRDLFVASQPVQRAGVAVPREAAAQTLVVGHAAAVTPGAASVLGHIPAAVARPPAAVMHRVVVARIEPPAAATRTSPVMPPVSRRTRPAPTQVVTPESGAPATTSADSRLRTDDRTPRDEMPSHLGGTTSDRPPASRTDMSIASGTAQTPGGPQANRPAAASARPVSPVPISQRSNGWRPAPGTDDTPTVRAPQNDRPIENTPAVHTERAAPRDERPAPSYERPAPRDDRSTTRDDRSTTRDDRPAPSAGVRESSAPDHSAHPSGDARPAAPTAAPASSARPADHASERPQPPSSSGGRGGQSEGSARPGGGRGGQK
jgi:hypothetical protein